MLILSAFFKNENLCRFSARIPESVFKDLQDEDDFEDIRREKEAAAASPSKAVPVKEPKVDPAVEKATLLKTTPPKVISPSGISLVNQTSVSELAHLPPSSGATGDGAALGTEDIHREEQEEDNSFDGLFHAFDAGMVKYHDNTTNNPLDNLKGRDGSFFYRAVLVSFLNICYLPLQAYRVGNQTRNVNWLYRTRPDLRH